MTPWVVVLAGGGGARLWPASTRALPKQVAPLLPGGESLLSSALRRASTLASPERIAVVTAPVPASAIRAALVDFPGVACVVEPSPRNTGPAVALGLAWARSRGAAPGDPVLVLPADTWVADEGAWLRALRTAALRCAALGGFGTLSVLATWAAPQFGWMVVDAGRADGEGTLPVTSFVEKPPPDRAAALLAGGGRWNAGVFVLRAAALDLEPPFQLYAESVHAAAQALIAGEDPGPLLAPWPSEPFDRLVLERAASVWTVPLQEGWADLGGWETLAEQLPVVPGGRGVAAEVQAAEARGNVVFAPDAAVVLLGVEDLVVAVVDGRILVARRQSLDALRSVVEAARVGGAEDRW